MRELCLRLLCDMSYLPSFNQLSGLVLEKGADIISQFVASRLFMLSQRLEDRIPEIPK